MSEQKPMPTSEDKDNSKPPATYQNRSGTVRVGNRDIVVTYKSRKEKPT